MFYKSERSDETDNTTNTEDKFQHSGEIRSMKISRRTVTVIITAITLLIVATGITIGYIHYQNRKEAKEAKRLMAEKKAAEEAEKAKEEQEAKKRSQEYIKNLELVTYTMLIGASDAESCCNLIAQVWHNAIWQEEDENTDKYTKPDGYFVTDFNDALDNLFNDSDFTLQINNVIENQESVTSLIKQLTNPPEEYEAAYKSLQECYEAYLTFTNLAIHPVGSYNTFSDSLNDADTTYIHCHKMLEIYLPD